MNEEELFVWYDVTVYFEERAQDAFDDQLESRKSDIHTLIAAAEIALRYPDMHDVAERLARRAESMLAGLKVGVRNAKAMGLKTPGSR